MGGDLPCMPETEKSVCALKSQKFSCDLINMLILSSRSTAVCLPPFTSPRYSTACIIVGIALVNVFIDCIHLLISWIFICFIELIIWLCCSYDQQCTVACKSCRTVWARECCRISQSHFLASCYKRHTCNV